MKSDPAATLPPLENGDSAKHSSYTPRPNCTPT